VTVGGVDQDRHDYVIEKSLHGQDTPEAFQNGVYVSSISDTMKRKLHHATLRCQLHADQIRAEFVMLDLRNFAVEMGPYDLESNNCHHTARAVYNFCAKTDYREEGMPNELLILIHRFGLPVVQNLLSGCQMASKLVDASRSASDILSLA